MHARNEHFITHSTLLKPPLGNMQMLPKKFRRKKNGMQLFEYE
jgi:hypothetical protein